MAGPETGRRVPNPVERGVATPPTTERVAVAVRSPRAVGVIDGA
jgi:hypothetical protein